jgi:hypothetical protein
VSLYPYVTEGDVKNDNGYHGYYDGPYTYPNNYMYTITVNNYNTQGHYGFELDTPYSINYIIILLLICVCLDGILLFSNIYKDCNENETDSIQKIKCLNILIHTGMIVTVLINYLIFWGREADTLKYWNTCNDDTFAPFYNNDYFGSYVVHYNPNYTTLCNKLKVYEHHICANMDHIDKSIAGTGRWSYTDYIVQINMLARIRPMAYTQIGVNVITSAINMIESIISWCC